MWTTDVRSDGPEEPGDLPEASKAASPKDKKARLRVFGCLGIAVIVIGLVVGCGAVLAQIGGQQEDHDGCSYLLPTESFKECINR